LPFNSYSYADPYDITKRDCGVTVDLPHTLNVEASSVGVAVNDTGVTEPADDIVASCSSGRGVTSWACDDLDDTDRSSDCDSKTSTWEDRTSDSDYDVGLSKDCESESEIDDFGSPETDSEEELLRTAITLQKTEMEKQQHILRLQQKILRLNKAKDKIPKRVQELENAISGITSPELSLLKEMKVGYTEGDPWSCFMTDQMKNRLQKSKKGCRSADLQQDSEIWFVHKDKLTIE
jgi:hypothetical protein